MSSSPPPKPTLSANWRMVALALSLAWLGSVLGFIVIALADSSRPSSGIATMLVMLASLIVLALLRNLGKIVAGEFDTPGPWEVRLSVAGAAMLAGAWIVYAIG